MVQATRTDRPRTAWLPQDARWAITPVAVVMLGVCAMAAADAMGKPAKSAEDAPTPGRPPAKAITPAKTITPADARASLGKPVALRLTVKDVGTSGEGRFLELYSESRWDVPGCVFIRLPRAFVKRAATLGVYNMRVLLNGRTVVAQGAPEELDFNDKAGKPIVCVTVMDLDKLTILPPDHVVKRIEGFELRIDKTAAHNAPRELRELEAVFTDKLKQIKAMVAPEIVRAFQKVPITIRREPVRASAAYDWRDKPAGLKPIPDMRKGGNEGPAVDMVFNGPYRGVMIRDFYEAKRVLRNSQPLMLLHEFAHAYHHRVLRDDHKGILHAYENAMDKKLYEKVARYNSKPQKAYATTNHHEYFAELTEAWFGVNDYFPFNHDELKKHDPVGAKLMLDVWGEPRTRAKR